MRRLLVAILLATAGLAGCIGDVGDDLDEAQAGLEDGVPIWHDQALPFGPSHDHTDPAQHVNLSTPNFDVTGYTPLNSSFYGAPAGSYFCGDAQPTEDGRRLAAIESRTQVGFALADVTDPAQPEWLGELVMQTTYIYDLAVVPSGQHVVLVTSDLRDDATSEVGPTSQGADEAAVVEGATWRSPCNDGPVPLRAQDGALSQAEDPMPRPMQVILVDITDPAEPTIVDSQPLAGSGHSVSTKRVDGTDWAMVTTTRLPGPAPTPGVRESGISTYEFFQVADGRLALESVYKRPFDQAEAVPSGPGDAVDLGPRGHDGRLAVHPGTGDLIAYLAGGDRFSTLDMSDPSNPTQLGQWEVAGPATPAEEGTLHSVWPMPELWNGTHYTVVGPEHAGHPEGAPTGLIWVLDTTDPADPHPVAAWTLPAEVNWNGTYMFSPHYLTVSGQTLFVSMYHGGVWAVDLSTLTDGGATPTGNTSLEQLDAIGVWMPTREPPAEVAGFARWAPTSEEIIAFPDGSLASWSNTGLFTATFDASNPMPPPTPWALEDAVDLDG